MISTFVPFFKAQDAEDSFALLLNADTPPHWRIERAFGQNFQKVWTLEIQSNEPPDISKVNWDMLLTRVLEAYDFSDPLITDFNWNTQCAIVTH